MFKKIVFVLLIAAASVSAAAAVAPKDKAAETYINNLHEKQNGTNHKAVLDSSKLDDKEIEKLGRIVDSTKGNDKSYREYITKLLGAGISQTDLFTIIGSSFIAGNNADQSGKKFIAANTAKKNEKIIPEKIDSSSFTLLGKTVAANWDLQKYKSLSDSANSNKESDVEIYTIIGYSYVAGYNLMIDSMSDKNVKSGNKGGMKM